MLGLADATGTTVGRTHVQLTRRVAALACALLAFLTASVVVIDQRPANAWAWDPQVYVTGNVSSQGCPTTWMWYQADNGESGWASRFNAYTNYGFTLNRVSTSGTLVTLRFGSSWCSRAVYFVVTRPSYGKTFYYSRYLTY
jgi:hypothetical protein